MTSVELYENQLTIDYTDLDFVSMVAALRNYVVNKFPHITNFNPAGQTQMIIELFAATLDRLTYMQDKHADEAFIITARRRENILSHATGLNYFPQTNKAATGIIKATLDKTYSGDVTISDIVIKTKETSNPAEFYLKGPITILAGNLTGTGNIKNSLPADQQVFISDGTANQSFELDEVPFLDDGTLKVEILSEEWIQVETFIDSLSNSKHYTISINDEDKCTVIFGDGINGFIPPDSEQIFIDYEIGGGTKGNQLANTITVNTDQFISSISELVSVTFTNENPTAGGADRETNIQIKTRAPRSVKTNKRTICDEDYSINLEDNVPGVLRAKAFSSDDDPAISENSLRISIVPEDQTGLGLPSSTLLTNVFNFLNSVPPNGMPVPLTLLVIPQNPTYKSITIKGKIYIDRDVSSFSNVKNAVIDSIINYFSFTRFEPNLVERTIDWGKTVRWSPVIKEINKINGVNYISSFEMNNLGLEVDVSLNYNEIPRLVTTNFDTDYSLGGLEFIQL